MALVAGTLERSGNEITVEARAFDVVAQRPLTAKLYRGPANDLARVAHRFADEILRVFDFTQHIHATFGFTDPVVELSTLPGDTIVTPEMAERATGALRDALERSGLEYRVAEGEGSFYGPKIDLHATDSLGRSWQLGTIQLDAQMPARFGLTYMGADNREHPVFVVHRAFYGSFERFVGLVLEHYGGALPAWLAPVQVRVLPVAESHREAVRELLASLRELGVRAEGDERDETLGKRIRDAELQKIPYVVVWGDRETRDEMAVRKRGGEGISTMSLDVLVGEIAAERPA